MGERKKLDFSPLKFTGIYVIIGRVKKNTHHSLHTAENDTQRVVCSPWHCVRGAT
jgi:hypothetical protein